MSKHTRTWYVNELREFAAYPICPDNEDCETLRHCADLIESNPNAELFEALRVLAEYPIEDFGKENKSDAYPLFGANSWKLNVGHVRAARAALKKAQS